MSDNSKIEWTDATWNPVRGAALRYRQAAIGATRRCSPSASATCQDIPTSRASICGLCPPRWQNPCAVRPTSPKRVFVNSMSDLFHEDVEGAYIVAVARVMAMCSWHTFQVRTNRAEKMRRLLSTQLAFARDLPHIWWGVSVEDRNWAGLLRRTFVFACVRCRGRRRVLAYVKGAPGVRAILDHLGLPTACERLAPARGPPQAAWC